MIKLTSYGLFKCKISTYTTYADLRIITCKSTLEELKNLDFTPYINVNDLNKISKIDIVNQKSMPRIRLTNKVTGKSLELNLNNFYSVCCNNTECKNYNICN